jgi:peptidoglycan/LPS O-acetylase OafA/YrhL
MSRFLDAPRVRGRSSGIDLLRGWFSLQVLIFAHVVFWASYAQGPQAVPICVKWIGEALIWLFQGHAELNPAVLAFIVLSGYCIHRNGLRRGDPVGPFLIRRVFRIVPIFLLGTAAGVVLFGLSFDRNPELAAALTGTREISPSCVAAKLSIVASLWPIAHPCDFGGNAPLLTVMVEIGLYAVYVLVSAIRREALIYVTCTASVAAGAVIAFFNASHPTFYNWWQNSSLLAFLPYWWVGAAAVDPRVSETLRRWMPALVLAWISLTALSSLQAHGLLAELRKPVQAAIVAQLIVFVDRAAIPQNPLSLLGRAGYSIYALHAPVACYLLILGLSWWQAGALTIIVGVASYILIERPLDRLGHRLSGATAVNPILLSTQPRS